MANKNYNKGANFERWVKKYYQNSGYRFSERTPGSKGLWDGISISIDMGGLECNIYWQAKYNCRPTKAEMSAMRKFKIGINACKRLWIKMKGQQPKVEAIE